MDQDLGLRLLSRVMKWDDDKAVEEFRWLRLMASAKYDGYGDFRAGMRFIESLATWLQQFDLEDRDHAYEFVRTRLVYLGPSEMTKLVHQFYPRQVRPDIDAAVGAALGVPAHLMLMSDDAQEAASTLLRKTIFMALSDGARLDEIRHANAGLINNEQIVTGTQIDNAKWLDMLEELRTSLGDDSARFSQVYLIDDFAGTGTSFFRDKKAGEAGGPEWGGKLVRFRESILERDKDLEFQLLDDDWELRVHHYVGTQRAADHLAEALVDAAGFLVADRWAKNIHLSWGMCFDSKFPLARPRDDVIIDLAYKYYDKRVHDRHMQVGGTTHSGLGYGASALPLVLDHNTPNNSLALLWADSESAPEAGDRWMTPLFRRRKRHVQ